MAFNLRNRSFLKEIDFTPNGRQREAGCPQVVLACS